MTKKRIGKKFLTILVALAIVFTSIPLGYVSGLVGTAEAASGSYSGTLSQKNLSNYAFTGSKVLQIWYADYQRNALRVMTSPETGNLHLFQIGDFQVFCMEHGVHQEPNATLKATYYKDSKMYDIYKSAGAKYAIDNIFKILFYGPVEGSSVSELLNELGFKDSKYYQNNGSSYTLGDWTAATQMLVWESQQLMRDKDFNRKESQLFYAKEFVSGSGESTGVKIERNHYTNILANKPAMDIYNFIASKVKEKETFDRALATTEENNPKPLPVPENATFPCTFKVKSSGSGAGAYKVVDENNKKVDGITIAYDKTKKTYTITVENESVLEKTWRIMHDDGAAKRAEKYLGQSEKYRRFVWEYETSSSHTQAFASGLEDPTPGYLKLTKGIPPEDDTPEGECTPPDADVFPTVYLPIRKIDANPGFDGDNTTPMGDAGLDATYTLERQIAGGAWETIDTQQLSETGDEFTFQDQPFASAEDLSAYLTESGSIACDHPVYNDDGTEIIGYEHEGSKEPAKRSWDVTVNYRITETRPAGRYIDPDPFGGVREYSFNYHAESHDICTCWTSSDPWTDVEYTFILSPTVGAGDKVVEGPTANPNYELYFPLETFEDDVFRGELLLIKSNEKENPFKDSMAGGSDSNMSKQTKWTVRLQSKGYEGEEYVHLESLTPTVYGDGTAQYTVSRDPGSVTNDEDHPMVVGSNGSLLLKDLPYGTYIVEEVGTDDPMYVPEQFIVVVSEHNGGDSGRVEYGACGSVPTTGAFDGHDKTGTNAIGGNAAGTGDFYNNRYQVNLRDKIKSNVIQMQKVDSETGKVVRMEGTKVYLRYKGNPDYTDEENQARYGKNGTVAKNIYNRFLPNAESINSASTNYTFELDENGCFTIPYQLPYGKYEICEWLLPEGYYVGTYGEDGAVQDHDFGMIEEGDFVLGDIEGNHSFADTVAIFDANGNRVTYQDKEEYSFESLRDMVVNTYTFTVTEQEKHEDGNFSELVTFDGNRMDADPTYDKGDHPYTNYYKVAAVLNNAVKGKITVEKLGEELVGWEKVKKDGYEVLQPVFETASKLKDAVFGIFAAKEETLNDGSEGPVAYDAQTGEAVKMVTEKTTNTSNLAERITAFFGKLLHPKDYETEGDYEISTYSDASGAELWSMLERAASEGNVKRTLYVTPEQKDTEYKYVYEATDGEYNYRWDVEVTMSHKAGGQNVTEVNITKTTSTADGFVPEIPLTEMTGSVGDVVLDPIENYRAPSDAIDFGNKSILSAASGVYRFEADGETAIYSDGTGREDNLFTFAEDTQVDLSQYCPERYLVREYLYYTLTKKDLVTEERVVGTHEEIDVPGVDANGDGDFEDAEEGDIPPTYKTVEDKETKTTFEWNHNVTLAGTPAVGDRAVIQGEEEGTFKAAVKGYYAAGEYTDLTKPETPFVFITSKENGDPVTEYTIPEGWTKLPFTGDAQKDPQYVIITKNDEESGKTLYQVLLNDAATWQSCTAEGNFAKAAVQVYKVKYTQEAGDPDGFTVNFDGFSLGSAVDRKTGEATTTITKQATSMTVEVIDVGLGYEYEDQGDTITFKTVPVKAPIYFMTSSGIRAEMVYQGGVAYTTLTMPQSAVGYSYEHIVPTLDFAQLGADDETYSKILDWYNALSPENPVAEFDIDEGLPDGVRVIAKRIDTAAVGGEVTYTLEIITNQKEDHPLEVTFADGYTMKIYTAEAASGNGVGIIDLFNVYKTNRYTAGDLIETITTNADGIAESGLLPLGDYIVRELSTGSGYVNEGEDKLVQLKYKDQFTPLVWGDTTFENKYFTVQLDLSKVFETAYKSADYVQPKEGQRVVFGLFAAETITAAAEGQKAVDTKTIAKDSLIDLIAVTAENAGAVTVSTKLPQGNYYLKEIEAPDDYIKSDLLYRFAVREHAQDYSENVVFDYTAGDGIIGKIVMEEKGRTETVIFVERRYPMPTITIDKVTYPLDGNSETEKITIDADEDYTEVRIFTAKGEKTEITLPNGKEVTVKPDDNTFDYSINGEEGTFVPTVTYTGYSASYEEEWHAIEGEDLHTYTPSFTMTGAGTDKDNVILTAEITHTPSTTDVTGEGETITEIGNLTPAGNQIFEHSAVLTVKDSRGSNTAAAQYTRYANSTATEETLNAEGTILLNPKETVTIHTASGAVVTVSMDKYGVVKAVIENVLFTNFEEEGNPAVTTTGTFGTGSFAFAKNVTLGRQDTSADKLMIKINSDNKDAFAVKNDHKPYVELAKVDKENHNKLLSGARFEIYSAKPSGEWTVEPNQLLGTYTTGTDGKFGLTLDYGIYFYREISAPFGYSLDKEYHKFRVVKGEDPYQVIVENEKTTVPEIPYVPTTPGYLLEITKTDMETGETLAGAEFYIYGSHLENGVLVRDEKPINDKPYVTGQYGKLTIELDHAGTYYYHEVKAPAGYICDGEYYKVEIKNGTVIEKVTMVNEKDGEPSLKTRATGSDGEKVIGADKKVTIVDTVTYENLTPGKEYTLKGTLMNKDTGKALTADGKKVTAEKTFTPKTENGTVEMTFTFDARELKGLDIVVFEKLYLGSKLVAKHTDINDEGQTVTLLPSQNPTSPAPPDRSDVPVDVPRTGDSGQRVLYLLLIALSMGFLSMVFALERRYEKHE